MSFRRNSWLLFTLEIISYLLIASCPVSGDADFESVRVRYDYDDNSGRGGDPVEKYWRKYLTMTRPGSNR